MRSLSNRRNGKNWLARRCRSLLNFTRLEDRTVPSSVITTAPGTQSQLYAALPHSTTTGSVKLTDRATDFYMSKTERVGLIRRDDQVGVFLPGGATELQDRLSQPNGPLMGYTVLRTLGGELRTFILQSPTTNAAATLNRLIGTMNGGWASPVFVDVGSNDWAISTNEVAVRLFNDADAASIFGGKEFASYSPVQYMPHVFRAQLVGDNAAQALAAANSLILDDRVDWASPNFFHDVRLYFDPNDPLYPSQYHLKNTGQVTGYVPGADIGANLAWDKTNGAGKTIALVDTGIESTHPDLAANALAGKDFTGSATGTAGSPTTNFHGTATAGLAAAVGNNNLGVTGVAYGAKFLPARIFDDNNAGTTDINIASALSYAYQNADVVSNSWGYNTTTDVSAAIDQALIDAGNLGRGGKGSPIFFATGNNGYNGFPANKSLNYSNVIAVGGSTPEDTWRGYSSGAGINIVAPTDDFGGTGTGIITTDRTDVNGYNTATSAAGGDYSDPLNPNTQFGGTSSSTPIAAGVGALVLSQNNNLTATQLRGMLMNTSTLIEGINGAYNAKTGNSQFDGNGRVSASTAIAGIGKTEIDVSIIGQEVASGATVNFVGAVYPGTPSDGTFYIRNQGDQTLNLNSLTITGSTDFTITAGFTDSVTNKTTAALTVGQAAYFTIRFNPTGGAPRAAVAKIASNDADEGTYVINLAGDASVRSISGTVFRDADNSASYNPLIDTTLANQQVYLDLNNNGKFDINASQNFGGGGGIVPDADPNGVGFAAPVAGLTGFVADINVNVDISMTWDGDLVAYLIAPNGQFINLWTNLGGSNDNFTATVLDDQAASSINAAAPPFTGSFMPNQPLATFNGLTGANLNGTWTLFMFDTAGGDTATVNSWSLDISTSPDQSTVSNASGQYSFIDLAAATYNVRSDVPAGFFQTAPASGKYTVTIASPDDNFAGKDFGRLESNSISGHVFHDHNGNAAVDAGDEGLAARTVFLDANNNGKLDYDTGTTKGPTTFNSTNVPLAIPDGTGFVQSKNTVSGTGLVADVNLTLDISHTWVGDLTITLIAPDGTAIVMYTSPTDPDGDNMTNLTFDDESANGVIPAIPPGNAPAYTGDYQPMNPLSGFDGHIADGVWKLMASDSVSFDSGTINSWSLSITYNPGEASTTTDANGDYIFLNQAASPPAYNVRTVVPAGWNLLNPVGGVNSGSLTAGSALTGFNFGEALKNAIYGNTYLDVNHSNSLDAGDTPIANVVVYDDGNNNGILDVNPSTNSGPGSVGMVPDATPAGISLSLPVAGYVGAVNAIKVNFDATMTWDGDIQATLISPTGTTIQLFTNIGGAGDNFTATVFDDAAAGSIDAASPPYTGSFQPEQPLATFKGLSGAALNGNWTLHLVDVAAGDTMTVNSWSMDITTSELATTSDANGNYILPGLSAGIHNVRRITPAGLVNAEPAGNVYVVNLAVDQTVQNKNFGHVTQSAAKVSTITVNGGGAGGPQRSMVTNLKVLFDSHVTFFGGDVNAAAAFTMTNQKTALSPTLAAAVDNSGSGTAVTLTWTGAAVDTGSSLTDGRYTLVIKAAQFTGNGFNGGAGAGTDFTEIGAPGFADNLFRLFGDGDGNGTVNLADFLDFRFFYGGTAFKYDSDANGTIALPDFLKFRSDYGNSV